MFGFDSTMIYRIPALLIALTIHEYAHAQAADSEGDPTPRMLGRLTMNPLAHIDPIGMLLLLFAGFGWAKAVPFNPSNFRNISAGIKKVALAGVAANFFMAFISLFILMLMRKMGNLSPGVAMFLNLNIVYNIWFGVFNLIPLPPLDGSLLAGEFLPYNARQTYFKIEAYGTYILMALVFTGIAGMIIKPIAQLIIGLMSSVLGIIF